MANSENAAGSFWTMQESSKVGGTPWYALKGTPLRELAGKTRGLAR